MDLCGRSLWLLVGSHTARMRRRVLQLSRVPVLAVSAWHAPHATRTTLADLLLRLFICGVGRLLPIFASSRVATIHRACWSCPVDRRAAIHVLGLSTASCLVRPLLSVLAPNRRQDAKEVELCLGVAFLLGATYLALPSLSGGGVIRGFRWPRRVWQWSMLLSVVLFGASPYLGLSTAGCFTMFSNIATQGESSNHLLLGQNPFKMFRFQDDIVTVVSISPRLDGSWGLLPHRGQRFPRVLFSQWLDEVVSVRGA